MRTTTLRRDENSNRRFYFYITDDFLNSVSRKAFHFQYLSVKYRCGRTLWVVPLRKTVRYFY